MSEFRLDRSAFRAQTAEQAANHTSYYQQITWQERLEIAAYLTSVAYNYDINNPPRMDKSRFQAKTMDN
jgi:hypothetical protein